MLTLSTDFGSPYPAAMKGVILQATDTRLVDISHDFPRQDVRATAFWLREVLPYFPPAVHCVVVDPGVGTDRAALVVRVGEHAIVAPDNGVCLPVARELAGEGDVIEVFEIEYDTPDSATFHGRDVFAPTAAAVHETGVGSLQDTASLARADDYVDLTFPDPTVSETGASGEILVVDGFGNVITNVPGDAVTGVFGQQVRINGEPVQVQRTYAAVPTGQRLVTVGSHGNVELAVNQGRGDEAFHVGPGDRVELSY
ncbi:S-adenosyl-l-methionine hydroxide adenosyltransferase [Halobacteriales archaeon QS_4_62_28]|nr:MAG: S-adenosyl-l-methionine hydroxide adenosyltransferase [Halobacteriales archaeon QS_4_62_28]